MRPVSTVAGAKNERQSTRSPVPRRFPAAQPQLLVPLLEIA